MKTAALKEVAPARAARLSFSPKDVVWQLNLDQVESQSGRILSKVTGLASAAGSSTQAFDTGNVLYSKLRPYLNKVVCPDSPGIATTELVPLRPDPKKLDRQYLTFYLRSPEFVTWVSNEVAGAKMPRVAMKVFWDHEIPLPPLAEQKRIAAILDAADALRATRREALAQLDALLQSTFLTLFGDPVTNPMGWQRKKFSQIGSLDRGVSKHRPRNAPELLGGTYPLVQTGEVANCDTFIRDYKNTYSEVGLKQSKLWPAGTLCITIAANIAKTGILAFEARFPSNKNSPPSSNPSSARRPPSAPTSPNWMPSSPPSSTAPFAGNSESGDYGRTTQPSCTCWGACRGGARTRPARPFPVARNKKVDKS